MIRYQLTHKTHYHYEEEVTLCHNLAMMTPKSNKLQTCLHNFLQIKPRPTTLEYRKDYFGNQSVYFSLEKAHKDLLISAESIVEVMPYTAPNIDQSASCEQVARKISSESQYYSIIDYTLPTRFTMFHPEALPIVQKIFSPDKPIFKAALDLTHFIKKEFKFDNKATTILTPLAKVIKNRHGVCQDFTHLCLSIFRHLKLPVRYVSGYIETIAPPGQKKLRGVDASHAWFSVFCPDFGWVDFDPTNGQIRNDSYIEAAVGRDYSDIAPLKGIIFGGGKNKMSVSVDVHRL